MLSAIVAIAAVLAGALLGFLMGKSSAQAATSLLKTQIEATRQQCEEAVRKAEERQTRITQLTGELGAERANVQAEKDKYVQMKADLERLFGDIAARTLRNNTQSFLDLAKQELGAQNQQASHELAARETAIKTLVDPIEKALRGLDEKTQQIEQARAGAYGELKTLVATLGQAIPDSLNQLRGETAQLVTALRAPKTRGNWGELQLKRCVEYAGLVQYCSFSPQVSVTDEENKRLQPDMTIQLPNGREIVVDAKTPLDAFLDAAGSQDAATQKIRFEAHAQRVRTHLKELSAKAYWKQFDRAPDFVVCFLPSEALFSAALEADPSLIEFGAQSQVVMATPTTLIALLRAVGYGWQQSEITKSAKQIHDLGRKVYEKLVTAQGHVAKMGNSLTASVEAYNKLLGSMEGKGSVFSLGRQLGELVHGEAELSETARSQAEIRQMESPEWSQPLLDEGLKTD